MADPAVHFTTVLLAFFAFMNPIANAPVFLALTEGATESDRRRIALRALLVAFGIVTLFTILGRAIFDAFGITLPAFRIAGGVLVSLVGYQLLQGGGSSVHGPAPGAGPPSEDALLGVAVSPLALPILAGPGTLATAMSFAAESTVAEIVRVVGAFGVICVVTGVAFLGAGAMVRALGPQVIQVVSRLMGLILTVIGVQMLIEGVKGAIAA